MIPKYCFGSVTELIVWMSRVPANKGKHPLQAPILLMHVDPIIFQTIILFAMHALFVKLCLRLEVVNSVAWIP